MVHYTEQVKQRLYLVANFSMMTDMDETRVFTGNRLVVPSGYLWAIWTRIMLTRSRVG